MDWSSASDSHRGNRRTRNEDAVFASSHLGLWAVADGMGGHKAGDYASETIAQMLADLNLSQDLSECVDLVEDGMLEVNDHLRRHARTQCDGNTVGSTVVVLIVRGETGVALWAGDSRLYRMRGRLMSQITRDHNPVSDLLDSGGITEDEALNTDTHIITRAVGGQRDLHLDVAVFDVQPGDTMLLCTDGLYREIEPQSIYEALQHDVDKAVTLLMRDCLQGPARDNVSLVVARAEH
ncbi:MAG: protein phosphatase 2C domain-containing protein [Pseudomonadaceae bacterium]|nr:protein phosphatase 2C domain-containing protein [Pseudomonadaceae bacterium]